MSMSSRVFYAPFYATSETPGTAVEVVPPHPRHSLPASRVFFLLLYAPLFFSNKHALKDTLGETRPVSFFFEGRGGAVSVLCLFDCLFVVVVVVFFLLMLRGDWPFRFHVLTWNLQLQNGFDRLFLPASFVSFFFYFLIFSLCAFFFAARPGSRSGPACCWKKK